MPTFQHILFPVDFSIQNCGIAPYVENMACIYGARVTIFNVMELPAAAYPGWAAYGPPIDLQARAVVRKQRVDSFLKNEFQNVSTTRVMLEGDPASRISEYAGQEKVDLIMMPTHGYGPFRRFLLGSVTAKVLHDVKCPVWTSTHTPEKVARFMGYSNVLCAVDLSAKRLPLLKWASEFACEHRARLTLVHAIPAATLPGALEPEGGRFRTSLYDWVRADLARLQEQAGTTWETVLEGGEVAHVISEAARAGQADLIVIGRGVMQHLLGRMRTNVYSIIREVPCPVISI